MGWVATEAFGALVLLVLAAVLFVFFRRRVIGRASDVVNCGYRPDRAAAWRPGLLRMSETRLDVFPLMGWTLAPTVTLWRHSLDVSTTQPLEDAGGIAGLVDREGRRARLVVTTGRTAGEQPFRLDLALAPQQYTALRYWVESSPPPGRPLV